MVMREVCDVFFTLKGLDHYRVTVLKLGDLEEEEETILEETRLLGEQGAERLKGKIKQGLEPPKLRKEGES